MDKVILIRYGEIHLKGKNRGFFESTLIKNVKKKLEDIACDFSVKRARYMVSNFSEDDEAEIVNRLRQVFGIHSISIALYLPTDKEAIAQAAIGLCRESGSFKVSTNRADKRFDMTSVAFSQYLGGRILAAHPKLTVDLFDPDFVVNVDIREDGGTFLYADKILCAQGMPVGTAGKGMVLLSGGIDSPVATYMMAKRGLKLDAIHFHSYPYTSALAKQKVVDLAQKLSNYAGNINLTCIPFTKIQEEIHRLCDPSYMITLVRCFMMSIAERVAKRRKCGCLVNGESLGQVASQTLESINITNAQIQSLPIFRPCIGMDKEEIITIAKKIDTFELSILPYEDCCTVFLPDSPVIRPNREKVNEELAKIENAEELIKEAIENAELIRIGGEVAQ